MIQLCWNYYKKKDSLNIDYLFLMFISIYF